MCARTTFGASGSALDARYHAISTLSALCVLIQLLIGILPRIASSTVPCTFAGYHAISTLSALRVLIQLLIGILPRIASNAVPCIFAGYHAIGTRNAAPFPLALASVLPRRAFIAAVGAAARIPPCSASRARRVVRVRVLARVTVCT